MFFNYLTLFSALFISSVAIYYSVAGLAQIFAASAVSIIIMGTALEVGKLVVAVWLHKNWRDAVWWLKYYLSVAVLVLMFITSMGIFGYLSKSHVEQAAASSESQAQTSRIESSIARYKATIDRSEQKIQKYETSGSTVDSSLQTQIDKELERIANARKQVQEQIDQQIAIIEREEAALEKELEPYKTQIYNTGNVLEQLQEAINTGNIKKAQGIVGTKTDGQYGPATANKVKQFREDQEARIKQLIEDLTVIQNKTNPIKDQASKRLVTLDASVQEEIDKSNELIERLRQRVGVTGENDVEVLLEEEQAKIKEANQELDKLIEQKYVLEADVRKLEAEVGPIKYIAEFIYAEEANKNLLEEAVRWVIIIIIFVFDPLAVLLLIASQYSFERAREQGKDVALVKEFLDEDPNEELERVSNLNRIITEEKQHHEDISEDDQTIDDDMDSTPGEASTVGTEDSVETVEHKVEVNIKEDPVKQMAEEYLRAEVNKAIKQKESGSGERVILNRASDGYINFNGKTFQEKALLLGHPELHLDLESPVANGILYPIDANEGDLFFNCSEPPTRLMRFNGVTWDPIDKNILKHTAYSDNYINFLIEAIASNEYNPELLSETEKKKIEILLTKEV